jgi:serine/threonine protein kinase
VTKLNLDLSQSIKSASGEYYKKIQILGEGKSATAFLALKTSSIDRGTFCVMKLLQHPSDQFKLANFNTEQTTIKSLKHTSIMRMHDDGVFNGNGTNYPFYICDFYTSSLSEFIRNDHVKLTQKLSYAIQLCSALAYLSSNNIVHCDIKPDNIYTDGLKCVIADFGLSRKCGANATNADLPSLHKYRSPDIVDAINNNTPLTAKSDVFQLGLVLTELFTGVNPCLERKDGSSKVFVDDIVEIYGQFDDKIRKLLSEMLETNASKRPDANSLIDRWQTVLFEAYDYILKVDRNVF